jgi:hypothetical protein
MEAIKELIKASNSFYSKEEKALFIDMVDFMNKNQLKELKNILESEQNKYKKLKTKF